VLIADISVTHFMIYEMMLSVAWNI